MSSDDRSGFPSQTAKETAGKHPARFEHAAYQAIFEHMLNGMAYCRMLYEEGHPSDFTCLYTNPAFERQTGLRNVCGKPITEVIPGFRDTDPELFGILGRIARGGGSEQFEKYISALATWVSVSAYSPEPNHFVAIFDIITERKLAEEMLRRSEERYQDIFDNTSDLIQCVAPDGSFIYTNRTWRETLGYTERELAQLNLMDVLHPDSLACCQDRFRRLLEGETLTCITFKFQKKSGEPVYLAGDCGSLVKDGTTISTRGIFKNVSETVEVAAALEVSEARYQALYENAPDVFTTINRLGEILSINRTGARMLGYEVDELIGEAFAMTIHPEDQRTVLSYMEGQFAAPSPDNEIEYRHLKRDGSSFWVHQRVALDPDTRESRLLVVCRDITERRNLEQQLAYQATHDTLTNLTNRREFERRLQRVLFTTSETGNEHALCFLDLDQFKFINDTCGHVAGDELLRQLAALLQGQMRSRDTLARLGGDEFAILMEYCPMDRARRLAKKLLAAVQDFQFYWRSRRFSISTSMGIVSVRGERTIAETIALADRACYAAKRDGGNRIHTAPNQAP
ncbi:MAG TPA: PAS domain S-box protein [Gammaproteobacteria bacterium]|nr:PAS domain S-box protein [Gammaproteobacteria bacterium]